MMLTPVMASGVREARLWEPVTWTFQILIYVTSAVLVPVIISSYPFSFDDAKENKPKRRSIAGKRMSAHRLVLQ